MQFFDRKLSIILLFFTLPLLFLPKLNVMNVDAGETAGLRIDDLVLLFFGFLLICAHFYSGQSLLKIEGWIISLTLLSFFSFLLNRFFVFEELLPMSAKIFYVVRLLEYFMFFYIGVMAAEFFSGRTIILSFFLWNLLWMSLQKLNIAGGITFAGYHDDVSGRVQGIASFPSEMGLLLNLLFCYFLFEESANIWFLRLFRSPYLRALCHKCYLYFLFCLFGVLIIFTGNRISIVALLFCFFFRLIQELRARTFGSFASMLILIPIVAIALGFVAMKTAGVYERSAGLFSWKNLELFSVVWEKIDIAKEPADYAMMRGDNYDMSWWIRIHKWLFMTKSYVENPECYLQGLGPGYAGAALDGGILRIITEYGLIGVFLFWNLFASLYRINLQTKWMIIAFMCNMLFFDAYLAYKTMSLLFFSCGSLISVSALSNRLKI